MFKYKKLLEILVIEIILSFYEELPPIMYKHSFPWDIYIIYIYIYKRERERERAIFVDIDNDVNIKKIYCIVK